MKSVSSAVLAAVAMALGAAAFAADAPAGSTGKALSAGDKVHCYGLHECKGNSDCKTTANACKGHNACKGIGFKAVSAGECVAKKGVIGDL